MSLDITPANLRPAAGEGIHIPHGIKADIERGCRLFWAKRGGYRGDNPHRFHATGKILKRKPETPTLEP